MEDVVTRLVPVTIRYISARFCTVQLYFLGRMRSFHSGTRIAVSSWQFVRIW